MSDSVSCPLVMIPQHFGCLIFDRRTSRYLPFDHECTELLSKLMSRRPEDVLSDFDPGIRPTVIEFIEYFENANFFSLDGRLLARALDVVPPSTHLTGPLATHVEVVGACNLRCKHCFAGELPRNQNPLTLTELDGLFSELAMIGSFRLGLTGGEPLLRKDLFEIIDNAVSHGLHPCLTTNGTLIDETVAKEFGKRELIWLNVSLDGATASTNDSIRGKGSFDEVINRIKILRKYCRFTIAFTLTSSNVAEIEACATLARNLGAHTAVFRPMYPVGVALENLDLMPTFESYTSALELLENSIAPDEELRGIDPFSPRNRVDQRAKIVAGNGCGAGTTIATVSVQGDVNPCSFLGAGHNAANLRNSCFTEIWNTSQVFEKIRGLSQAANEDGDERFQGGCRARAQVYNGDYDAADPWFQTSQPSRHPSANIRLYQISSQGPRDESI